jgi:eukaryotic-like serine/threonine-protein kinase
MRPLGPADPAKIAHYRLFAELGAGGMGRVFLSCTPDGRLIALKRIRSQFADNPEFRVRFRAEVAASRKVSGAYTAAVIDSDVDAPEPWLASVFIPGPPLSDVVETAGTRACGWPPGWHQHWWRCTGSGWCIAISSRPTCCSPTTARG